VTYNEFIQNIIDTRGQWAIPECGVWENHHITPLCMGGLPLSQRNDTIHDNLIWLSPKEHYIAHRLLAEENPDNLSIQRAWFMISNFNKQFISDEEYQQSKLEFKKSMQGKNHPYYGKPGPNKGREFSEEWKKNISESHKGIGHPMSEETKQKISKAHIGLVFTDEHRNNLSKSHKGQIPHNKGIIMSEEQRLKISNSLKNKYVGELSPNFGRKITDEHRRNLSESHKGNFWWSNGVDDPVQSRECPGDGWFRGRKKPKII